MAHKLRRSQAVVPFGVGAIVDLEDDALMSAGLEAWPIDTDEQLSDDRLAARLRVAYFRPPPAMEGPRGGPRLPFVRFPYWHFCPRCRAIKYVDGASPKRPQCDSTRVSPVFKKPLEGCGNLPPQRRRRMVPLRFVIACSHGHIEDFPWVQWAHSGRGTASGDGEQQPSRKLTRDIGCDASSPALFFYATSRGGMGGLMVQCAACGKRRSLLGSTNPTAMESFGCSGARPWLGPDAIEKCEAPDPPQVLQRGASNLYFANTASSVLIPPFSKRARAVIDRPEVWSALNTVKESGRIPDAHIAMVASLFKMSAEEFSAAVRAKESGEGIVGEDDSEELFRFAEYNALQRANSSLDDMLTTVPADMSEHGELVQSLFESVVLVESLAETRVLTGFTRIEPTGRNVRTAQLSRSPKDWLPAYRVKGEGLFFKLRRDRLDRWRRRAGETLAPLVQRASEAPLRQSLAPTPELVVLHTLAHAIILRLSFEAGYGTASIRERLYCSSADSDTPMCGVLLYTAAGDADGTLGGLVRQGEPDRLDNLIRAALADARWCSADPVCRESAGQGIGSLNLAACHACALLPETSCELGNKLLDRLSLIGSAGQDAREGLVPDASTD